MVNLLIPFHAFNLLETFQEVGIVEIEGMPVEMGTRVPQHGAHSQNLPKLSSVPSSKESAPYGDGNAKRRCPGRS